MVPREPGAASLRSWGWTTATEMSSSHHFVRKTTREESSLWRFQQPGRNEQPGVPKHSFCCLVCPSPWAWATCGASPTSCSRTEEVSQAVTRWLNLLPLLYSRIYTINNQKASNRGFYPGQGKMLLLGCIIIINNKHKK